MKKVCIIGASGKLGKYMVRHALDRNHEVAGVCREKSKLNLDKPLWEYLLYPDIASDE